MTMINNIDISNVTIAILIAGYNKEVINKYERNITEKQNFIEHSQNIESEVNYQASNIMNLILGDLDVYGYSYNAKYYSKMQPTDSTNMYWHYADGIPSSW